jgi:hypothetical protein
MKISVASGMNGVIHKEDSDRHGHDGGITLAAANPAADLGEWI